jgi:hypothetical protein
MYKEREGHCRVPRSWKENGYRLGRWVAIQRRDADTMLALRRQRLDDLGFEWDPRETNWEEGFRYLTMYKEREGHCRVPQSHKENGFDLGRWVSKQRGHKDTLPESRRQRLDDLGFVWDPHEAAWEEGFRCLMLYKEREGHCRVPISHKENGFDLGRWVSRQRGYKDTLLESRRQRLDELGFVWDPHEAAWEEGFRCLMLYKEREGHCRVPVGHKEDGFRLGRWVDNQRTNRDTMPPVRRQRLDDLGFFANP